MSAYENIGRDECDARAVDTADSQRRTGRQLLHERRQRTTTKAMATSYRDGRRGEGRRSTATRCSSASSSRPRRRCLDELVDSVVLPALRRRAGDPAGPHAADRAGSATASCAPRPAMSVQRYFVDGGFAQVRDDVVTVLTHRAIPASTDRRRRGRQGAGDGSSRSAP